MTQERLLKEIDTLDIQLMDLILEHWHRFSNFSTWQFWVNIAFFLIPLVITLVFVDKKKIFQIAFYGYTFHVMFVYIDVFLSRFNYWDHPYLMIPYIPVSIPVDGSLVPVTFMLAYQIAINNQKNFYFVTFITAIIVAGMAWIWQQFELLILYNGMNLLHLFLLDLSIAILAYWFTNFFKWLNQNHQAFK
ncbi:hypothetical protein [Radiobacillus sp. PE A8.2]|uniref:hypothetical protein n=1 Tax=Radiobacillus sp. PE A8.2 TaxID=3380349 RepID=UPI00388EECD9